MVIWLWIALIGLVILILSMVFDGIEELFGVLDFADGLLSLVAIGSGLLLTGVSGYALENANFSMIPPAVLAIGFGVLSWIAISRIVKNLKKRALATVKPIDLIGLGGVATEAVNDQIGEVQLDHSQELNKRLAITSTGKTIPRGTRVVVIGETENRIIVLPSQ